VSIVGVGTAAGTYHYTITLTGGCGYVPVTTTGTIIVIPASVGGSALSDQNVCYNSLPNDNLTLSSYVGTIFQWQVSSNNIDWTDISGATASTLSKNTMGYHTFTKYYRCAIKNTTYCSVAYSSFVIIQVYDQSVGGDAAAVDTVVCSGQAIDMTLTGYAGSIIQWQVSTNNNNNSYNDLTGYTGTPVSLPGITNTTTSPKYRYYRAKVQYGPTCTPSYSDTVTITIEGGTVPPSDITTPSNPVCKGSNVQLTAVGAVCASSWGCHYVWGTGNNPPSNSITQWPWPNVNSGQTITINNIQSTTTYWVMIKSNKPGGGGGGSDCDNNDAAFVTINVDATSVGGTAASNQTICYDTQPANISLSGYTGTIQWQDSASGTWSNITGATASTYNPGQLTVTKYYRAKVTNGACAASYSNKVTITVIPNNTVTLDQGATNQPACINTAISNITFNTTGATSATVTGLPAGVNGAWASNVVTISGTPTVLGSFIYTITLSGGCGAIIAKDTITVYPPSVEGTAASSQTICDGSTPADLTLAGFTGTIIWQKSPANVVAWSDITGATTATLAGAQMGTIADSSLFRAKVTNSVCASAYSNEIKIRIFPVVTAGTVAESQSICYNTPPAAFTQTVAPTGGSNSYTYQWQQDPTCAGVWSDISGATASTYQAAILTESTCYRRVVTSDLCASATSNVINVNVYDDFLAGTISQDQTLCYNTAPEAFTQTSPTGGSGSYTYEWQMDLNCEGNWTTISGASSSTYHENNSLSETVCYRRNVSDNLCGTLTSNTVEVTVNGNFSPGAIGFDQTIPYDSPPGTFTQTSQPTGATGSYDYQWQVQEYCTGAWADISGAESSTYQSVININHLTCFRRVVTSGTCGSVITNVVSVSVYDVLYPGTIGTDQTICNNTAPVLFTNVASPVGCTGNYQYQWQQQPNCANSWSNIIGATESTYQAGSLIQTTCFRRNETSGSCGSVSSNTITVTVTEAFTPGTIGSDQTVCTGTDPYSISGIISPAGGSGSFTYQWQSTTVNGCGSGWADISGATESTYQPVNLTQTTCFRRKVINTCGTVSTNTVTIVVMPNSTIVLSSAPGTDNQTVCVNELISTITYASTGSTGASFSGLLPTGGVIGGWASNTVTITGAPTVTGTFNYTVTLNGGCGNVIATGTITVIDAPAQPDSITKDTLCNPPAQPDVIAGATIQCRGNVDVEYSVTNVPGVYYHWVYLPDSADFVVTSGQGTNAIMASISATANSGILYVIPNDSCGNGLARTLTITVSSAAPSAPGSISGNMTVCSTVNQAFSIAAVPGAVSYYWTYSGTGTVSGTTTVCNLYPLTSGTLSVQSVNGCDTSTAQTLSITVNNPPPVPTASAASNINTLGFTANWGAATGATGYYLDVASDINFNTYVSGYYNLNVGNVNSLSITGLNCATNYYYRVRSYNNYCSSLSSGKIILTTSPCGCGTVTDAIGNNYGTVIIGTRCWMNENLKTTKYSNGTDIEYPGTNYTAWSSNTTGAYAWYENDEGTYKNTYGALYNWYAATNTNKLCPPNWTVPSDLDWQELEMALGMSQSDAGSSGWRGTDEGGQIKKTILWNAPNTGATNTSGFSAIPGGRRSENGTFNFLGMSALFWTSNANGTTAYGREAYYGNAKINREGGNDKLYGFSVRCIKSACSAAPDQPGVISGLAYQCPAVSGQIYSITPVYGATSYTWNVPTGWTITAGSGTSSITVTTGAPSLNADISVVAVNSCGTSDPRTLSVVVNQNNTRTLTSSVGTNNQIVCKNTPITDITYSTTGATGATFSGLPTGVTGTWAANVITITGTPSVAGTFNYAATLTGGCGNVVASGTITVKPNNVITLTSANGTNNQAACINTSITNITYSTVGATGATFSGMPNGVTGSFASNTVTISGIPTQYGAFNYTVTLTGGCGTTTASGFINVTPYSTVTLSSGVGTETQSLCINDLLTNITYTTTGATDATVSGLPNGVTGVWAANTVTISGSPTQQGTFNYSVLLNGCGNVSATGTIIVKPINTIVLTSAFGTDNQPVCINVPLTNITYATTVATGVTVSGLPAGIQDNWTSNVLTISGTPTTAGTYNYTITLTGGCGTLTKTGKIIIMPASPPQPTTIYGLQTQCPAMTGQIYNVDSVSNATAYTWTKPTGWSITSGAGTKSITVTTGNAGQGGAITVSAGNSCGNSADKILSVTVAAASVGGTITGGAAGDVCTGSSTGVMTVTGNTGSVVDWEKTNNNGASWTSCGVTTTTYSEVPSALGTWGYRVVIQNSTCATDYSAVKNIQVNPLSVGGTASSAQTICYNTQPANITLVGYTGTVQWQESTDNITFTNVTGATSPILTSAQMGYLTSIRYYRAQVTSGACNVANSNVITVTVNQLSVGGTASSNQTICTGTQPANLTLAGYIGLIQWQVSTNGTSNWNNISLATAPILAGTSMGTLTSTMYYRALVTSGVCTPAVSNTVTITVNNTGGGTLSGGATPTCINTTTGQMSVSGYSGTILRWEKQLNAGGWTTITNVANTYNDTPTQAGTWDYRVVVQSVGCSVAYSSVVSIVVNPASVGGTAATSQTICYNTQPANITLTGNTGTIQWQVSTDNNTFNDISGATATPLTGALMGALTATRYYRAKVTSGACTFAYSTVVTVTVSPLSVAGTATSNQTICSGSTPANLTLTGYTGAIQWQESTNNTVFTNMIGSTSATLTGATIGALTATKYYRAVVTSGVCASANSNSVTITVNAPPTAPTSITGTATICSGNTTTLTASGGSEGSGCSYQWGTGATPGSNIISGATSVTYTTTTLSSTTTYWVRRVGNTSCTNTTSGVSQVITVDATPVGGTASSSQSICNGSEPANLTLSGNAGAIQWQVSTNNSTWADISGSTTATLDSTAMGVLTATRYYRAKVTSGVCSATYSNTVTVSILVVTDVDGNNYNTMKIGTQCWMKDNLKTTKFKDNTSLTYPGTNNTTWMNDISGAYAWYNNNISNKTTYGALYNWAAINNNAGICPVGWQVPTDDEFKTMEVFLGMCTGSNTGCVDAMGARGTDQGSKLKAASGWGTNGSNTSGFTALPGGTRATDGTFNGLGSNGYFWTNSQAGMSTAFSRGLSNLSTIDYTGEAKEDGRSIRCIKD